MTEIDKAITKKVKPKPIYDINQVSLDFATILNDQETHDIKIVVGENKTSIYSHKIILSMRSKIFKKLLSENPNLQEIQILEHQYSTVIEFIRYLYTGGLNLTDDNWKAVLPLADEHQISKLKELCFAQMIKKVKVDSVCSLILYARSGKEKYYDDIFVEKMCFINCKTSK